MLADQRYCYPLTITDFASRNLICCDALLRKGQMVMRTRNADERQREAKQGNEATPGHVAADHRTACLARHAGLEVALN